MLGPNDKLKEKEGGGVRRRRGGDNGAGEQQEGGEEQDMEGVEEEAKVEVYTVKMWEEEVEEKEVL